MVTSEGENQSPLLHKLLSSVVFRLLVNRRITKEEAEKKSENKAHHPSRKGPEGFGALKNKANLKVI